LRRLSLSAPVRDQIKKPVALSACLAEKQNEL
jgi:hypothetical protein